jgi:O-antigen/teichoic acid export membrane protein
MFLFNREFINSFCVIAPAVVLAPFINMWLVPDYGFIIATIAQVGNITYWSLVSSWAESKKTSKESS